ncbi:MAG TPA: ketoacyl-ACP synthase III, partial [Gemmatimonadaceae bacterium]|nr:ketoacyl-ACP synthase III [Gemmatimonadaceae bacterium]
QNQLGLSKTCGALDINLGCSGYVYGLGLAKGLIETGQARRVLFLTGDTHSKMMHPRDRSVRALFGDAGTATIIADEGGHGVLSGPFAYGTDGKGGVNLIVPAGGMRQPRDPNAPSYVDEHGNERTSNNVYMNGAEIFAFTVREVPNVVNRLLDSAKLTIDDVDFFVLHQASAHVLSHFQRKLRIPPERFAIDMADCGNTGSSTIPIALSRAVKRGAVRPGMRVMLVGFGVGYSWGATLVHWQ